jgi:hypothetical protein
MGGRRRRFSRFRHAQRRLPVDDFGQEVKGLRRGPARRFEASGARRGENGRWQRPTLFL